MKRCISLTLVLAILFALGSLAFAGWKEEAVSILTEEGKIQWDDPILENLDREITRIEVARLAVLIFGGEEPASDAQTFSDIPQSDREASYYAATAQHNGYVNGTTDGNFQPYAPITRQDFFTIVARACNLEAPVGKRFSDAAKIAAYSARQVNGLCNAEIVYGYEDNTIRPRAHITVAEALAVLARALKTTEHLPGTGGEEITELFVLLPSHPSWPYREDWDVWRWIEEHSGVKLSVRAIPLSDYSMQLQLLLAVTENLPDLIYYDSSLPRISGFMERLIPLSANESIMPHYTSFLASLPHKEQEELLRQRRAVDGQIYSAPTYGPQEIMSVRTWMYRKDIFEKMNLAPPTTQNELYTVCKKLKKLYPDAYPLCFRSGLQQIDTMAPMWKKDFSWGVYYDFTNQKWCLGAQDTKTMLEIVTFFHKMHQEGLIPPDFLTISGINWDELVLTDRGFVMPDYLVRIDYFNDMMRRANPDATWAVMQPPQGSGANGQQKIAKMNFDLSGYMVVNTGDMERIDRAIEFVDWMYSDEATELLSWGVEGESYTQHEDGTRSFNKQLFDTVHGRYGIGTNGAFQRITTYAASYSNELNAQKQEALSYPEDNVNPIHYLQLNAQEQEIWDQSYNSIISYCEEMLSQFICGIRPMSEWDAFQKELVNLNVEEVLAAYTSAYNRAVGQE